MKTAVIAGATGLVGQQLLAKLLASSRYGKVIALTRRSLALHHPKLDNIIITDFSHLGEALSGTKPDDVFCCLGTTMAKAGSKEKFYAVDFQYPFDLANVTLGLGARQYLLVSALGADQQSKIYYNRVKGELEQAIREIDFETIHIFRPSLLLGERSEKRPGEEAAKLVYKVFSFAVSEKYKGIPAEKVADAMIELASRDMHGTYIHESKEMRHLH